MVEQVAPVWICALQTLRIELEDWVRQDARDHREVERAVMIVREFAANADPDELPAEVQHEEQSGKPTVDPGNWTSG